MDFTVPPTPQQNAETVFRALAHGDATVVSIAQQAVNDLAAAANTIRDRIHTLTMTEPRVDRSYR